MHRLTSRDRMLRTLNRQDTDHSPCCFMSFAVLRHRSADDRYRAARTELEMGLDAMLFIPEAARSARSEHPDLRGLPVRLPSQVETREWREVTDVGGIVLHKEYLTPAGPLTTSVRYSDDWPHGDHIPFIDDYQVPRAIKPLVSEPQDLAALSYLLTPPTAEDVQAYQSEASTAHDFCRQQGVLLAGGWGVGMDMANWLCGMQELSILAMTQPQLVRELLGIIGTWNRQRMAVVLAGPVDLYIRRAWYEGCDFVPPKFFRDFVLPGLKAEAALAHENGAKFGYICTSGTKPMLDMYREADIDVLIGLDPIQGTHTDMPLTKEKLGDAAALWGGVSAAVTLEMGTEDDVRCAVRNAVDILGPQGLILSPVDNVTVDAPQTWRNIDVFIDAWRQTW